MTANKEVAEEYKALIACVEAVRSLLNSIPDSALDEVRDIWGNTNVAVVRHWKEQVCQALERLKEKA